MSAPKAWPIREFARGLLGDQSKHKAVAMLVGYFDESGADDNREVVMYGGIVARSLEWAKLEVRWRSKLAEYGLSEYHGSHSENRIREFSGFEEPIRTALTNYFSTLVAEIDCQAFGSAIFRSAWDSLTSPRVKEEYGGNPLYFSAALALQQVSRWSRDYQGGEPVAIVFDDHQKHSGRLLEIHSAISRHPDWPGLGSISFANSRLVIPLQCADLVCYEMKRFLSHPEEPKRQARKNFDATHKMSLQFMGYDATSLPSLVDLWNERFPSSG